MITRKTRRLIAGPLVFSIIFLLFGRIGFPGSLEAAQEQDAQPGQPAAVDLGATYLSGAADQSEPSFRFTTVTSPLPPAARRYVQGEFRLRTPFGRNGAGFAEAPRRPARTCTVVSRNNAGAGTLRNCLQAAANDDVILFDTTVFPPAAPQSIMVTSQLPTITVDRLVVDASNAGVILDGSATADGSGLVVVGADGVVIRGLQVVNFPVDGIDLGEGTTNAIVGGDRAIGAGPLGQGNLLSGNGDTGVWVHGAGTTDNRLVGNFIGTDVTGRIARPNNWGIVVGYDASDNIIGGSTLRTRNLISGNTTAGVQFDNSANGNRVEGNDIGVDGTGTAVLGNQVGIHIMPGAHDNQIGGLASAKANVISGNTQSGVVIQGPGADRNLVVGNVIGSDSLGVIALSNRTGIFIDAGARANIVGGVTPQARNVISGNADDGILVQGPETNGNSILGNYIGTNAVGSGPLPNLDGVVISYGAQNNVIGGGEAGAGNLISGNLAGGIWIQDIGTVGNAVRGNFIGVDASGTTALANENGILVQYGAQDTAIGGLAVAERNLISGNLEAGVHIQNSGTSGNRLLGNYIGTDGSGTSTIPNEIGVVILAEATENTVGGATPGARNLISGNRDAGVVIQDDGTSNNHVVGNYIGTNATGLQALNNRWGVVIFAGPYDNGPDNNIIGGVSVGEGNLISGNTIRGVEIQKTGTTGNQVLGNLVGTDGTGTRALGNGWGVLILLGASSNVIGGTAPGARNIISGNIMTGVHIEGEATAGNRVVGNIIGADGSGQAALHNIFGVQLRDGAQQNTIGPGNIIVFNSQAGVAVVGANTVRNTITRNSIHSNGGKPIDFPNAPVHPLTVCYAPTLNRLSGSTCRACKIEVFAHPGAVLAGTQYLDTAIADSQGNVSSFLAAPPPPSMPSLSVTLTDQQDTTGEFHAIPMCAGSGTKVYLPLVGRN